MTKVWAIHGGGDWADASANYLILADGFDIEAEKAAWQKWYRTVYCSKRNEPNKVPFKTFPGWLIERGAREPSKDELEIFEDL